MLLDQDFGKFKDQNGRYRTLSLFLEYRVNKVPPLWTLKKYELPGNPPSLYLQYLEARDPTEYDFAMAQFGTFEHWEVLQNCNWFKPYLAEMRKDLTQKLKAEHYAYMKALLDNTVMKMADKIAVLKWLSTNSGYEQPKSTRGRPSKEEVEGRLKDELKTLEEVKDDSIRLGL